MRQISTIFAAGLAALFLAGCAVEVPMSAFRVGPLDAEQAPPQQAQPETARPVTR